MRIPFFGTDPRQQRIDSLVAENLRQAATIAKMDEELTAERFRSREKGRLASELLAERDAARIERDTAQRERDGYREQLLRFTGPRQRGEHGRFVKAGDGGGGSIKPTPNGAQEVRA